MSFGEGEELLRVPGQLDGRRSGRAGHRLLVVDGGVREWRHRLLLDVRQLLDPRLLLLNLLLVVRLRGSRVDQEERFNRGLEEKANANDLLKIPRHWGRLCTVVSILTSGGGLGFES